MTDAAGAAANAASIRMAGLWTTITGTFMSSIAAFYGERQQERLIESQASSLKHQRNLAVQNAQMAEFDADQVMRAAQLEKGKVQLRGRQEQGELRTSAAARGVSGASTDEVEASRKIVQEIDEMTIDSNAARAAAQRRLRGTELRGQGTIALASSRNLSASARSSSAGLTAGTTLLGGAGLVSRQLADDLSFSGRRSH